MKTYTFVMSFPASLYKVSSVISMLPGIGLCYPKKKRFLFHDLPQLKNVLAVRPTFALNSILRQRYLAYRATMWPYRSCNFAWE